jgi:hypothetical protein
MDAQSQAMKYDYTQKKSTNGPLLYHQKISTGRACTEILLEN